MLTLTTTEYQWYIKGKNMFCTQFNIISLLHFVCRNQCNSILLIFFVKIVWTRFWFDCCWPIYHFLKAWFAKKIFLVPIWTLKVHLRIKKFSVFWLILSFCLRTFINELVDNLKTNCSYFSVHLGFSWLLRVIFIIINVIY